VSDGLTVLVVPTGTANLASIKAAFGRLGATVVMAENPDQIDAAERVVLPGVGAFGASMTEVREHGFHEPLAARIRAGRPTMAVCVGLQLLFDASEESDGVPGLGVLPGTISRLPATLRVPQLGWNQVEPGPDCAMIEPGHAYFANSYRAAPPAPDGWAAATADHGGPMIAALERGAVLGCQFHPELSGAWGQALMGRWLARSTTTGSTSC
jgi:imidazole glycerol phosphate synthase glutamine amidotransferase subunit